MFFFGKKDLKSLSDAEVEKEYSRDKTRRKRREVAKNIVFLGLFFGGMAMGVGAMAAVGLLSMGGGGALAMAFCGAFGGCLATLGGATHIKALTDWMEAKDLNAIAGEQIRRVQQEEERQKVLTPAAAEAFAASVGTGVKDDVKIMKPLTFRAPGKSRRTGLGAAFQ